MYIKKCSFLSPVYVKEREVLDKISSLTHIKNFKIKREFT